MSDDKLQALREQIDAIDSRLQEDISERARLAGEVAKVKTAQGDESSFYRPEREAQVLRKVIEKNQGPLSGEEMARLFREIMSACLALEKPLDIAYLGPEGTFTQNAALKHFGHSVTTTSLDTIDEVFREVESGACHYGVVPVENSTEGVINHTLDMFMQSTLQICGEVELRIHHHLLSHATDISSVKKVYAHQQALAQCRRWLDANLASAERVAVNSNAEAARIVASESDVAAIAGDSAAEFYQLEYLQRNIEDEPENTTRFLVIGHQNTPPSGDDKTSILFSTPNKSGALYHLLGAFAEVGISMTRIESRPSRQSMWDYVFFVDIEGHMQDQNIAMALKTLKQRASVVKLLGSYPRAVL